MSTARAVDMENYSYEMRYSHYPHKMGIVNVLIVPAFVHSRSYFDNLLICYLPSTKIHCTVDVKRQQRVTFGDRVTVDLAISGNQNLKYSSLQIGHVVAIQNTHIRLQEAEGESWFGWSLRILARCKVSGSVSNTVSVKH